MDKFIVNIFLIDFCLFIIFHFIVFRFFSESKVFKGLVLTFILAAITGFLISLMLNNQWYHLAITAFTFSLIVAFIVYLNFAFFYTLAFFGIAVTSLRVQLLSLIGKTGSEGITSFQLTRKYNINNIIKVRLDRLVDSGVLSYKNGYYKLDNKFSYFLVHQYIIALLKRIYLTER